MSCEIQAAALRHFRLERARCVRIHDVRLSERGHVEALALGPGISAGVIETPYPAAAQTAGPLTLHATQLKIKYSPSLGGTMPRGRPALLCVVVAGLAVARAVVAADPQLTQPALKRLRVSRPAAFATSPPVWMLATARAAEMREEGGHPVLPLPHRYPLRPLFL